jgi:hypothetical protein
MHSNPLLRVLLCILAFGYLAYSAPYANDTEINSRHHGHHRLNQSASTTIHDHQYNGLDKRAFPPFQLVVSADGMSYTAQLDVPPGLFSDQDALDIAEEALRQIDVIDTSRGQQFVAVLIDNEGAGAMVSSIPRGIGAGSFNAEINNNLESAPIWAAKIQQRTGTDGAALPLNRIYHAEDGVCYLYERRAASLGLQPYLGRLKLVVFGRVKTLGAPEKVGPCSEVTNSKVTPDCFTVMRLLGVQL